MLSPAQVRAAAAESYAFWISVGAKPVHAYALLGNEDGETSFVFSAVGDHGEAHGMFQWHDARADAILKGCGIDVRKASHADQLRAAHYEMTKGWYKGVWPALMATETIWAAVTLLVAKYEQSALPARDIRRRVGLAQGWQEALPH